MQPTKSLSTRQSADKLVTRAREGERLSFQDRRYALQHLMQTEPGTTNASLGELFQVSERQIRLDKKFFREQRAQLVKEEDISLVIADIALNFERQIADLETHKRRAAAGKGAGSRTYLEYCKAIFNMELQRIKALQDLGYYPKNLGTMTENKFVFSASVSVMGDGDKPEQRIRPASDLDTLDAEFTDVPLLEAPSVGTMEVLNGSPQTTPAIEHTQE